MSDPTPDDDGAIENPFEDKKPLTPEETLRQAVREAIKGGELSEEATEELQTLRESLGLSQVAASRIFDEERKRRREAEKSAGEADARKGKTGEHANRFDASCWMMIAMLLAFLGVFWYTAGERIHEFNDMLGTALDFLFSKLGLLALVVAVIAVVLLGGC